MRPSPLPGETTASMAVLLERFARQLVPGTHAVLVLDQTGRHASHRLIAPELNRVERVWLHLRERYLSLRVFADYRAIVDACCQAWNRLVAEPGRLRSLCDQPWIRKVSS